MVPTVYVQDALLRKWLRERCFYRLRSRNFSVKGDPCNCRPIKEKIDEIIIIIIITRMKSDISIAIGFNIYHQTRLSHLNETGYKKKMSDYYTNWRELTNLLSLFESLLKRKKIKPSLKRLMKNISNSHNLWQGSDWRQTRWCLVGSEKESCIIKLLTKRSIWTFTVNN